MTRKVWEKQLFLRAPNFHEEFWREYFKILVLKKRVKQLFSRLKKSEEKKTYERYLGILRRFNKILSPTLHYRFRGKLETKK